MIYTVAKNKARHPFHFLFRILLLIFLPAIASKTLCAQDTIKPRTDTAHITAVKKDSAHVIRDSVPLPALKPPHSPRKAAFYSAVLPGLGQAYNREYWKIPLVYAAMGISAGFFISNFATYKDFRDAYRIRMDGNANTIDKYADIYRDANALKVNRDAFRQYVDYSVLVFILAYGLNIIDATVFAHLRDWNMNDDLSMRLVPKVEYRSLGVGLQINLGKGSGKRSAKGMGWALGK